MSRMENNFVLAFLLSNSFLYDGVVSIQCSRGEMVSTIREGVDVCVPCEKYTFVAEDNHSYRTCRTCTFIEDPDVEVFVSFCNRTHDSVILCTSGFYRRRARNDQQTDRCEKCTECEFPARACEGSYDTVCCHPNQEVVLTSGGVYVCRDIPIVCGSGQFFSISTGECLPCPAGTFMPAHNHTYKECLKCEQLSENNATHAIIIQPCSRTASTLFGCKDGYFRDPTQEPLQTEVSCTPCRDCQLSLTECGMFHDAVCDSKDTMSSPAPANNTESTGTPEVADMIKHRKSSLNRLANCTLYSIEDKLSTPRGSTSQSVSKRINCSLPCLSEADEAKKIAAGLRTGFCIVMLALFSWSDKVRNKRCKLFTYVLYGFLYAFMFTILIVIALLECSVIEEQEHWIIVLTVICYVVFIINLARILIAVRNNRPKHVRNRNDNK